MSLLVEIGPAVVLEKILSVVNSTSLYGYPLSFKSLSDALYQVWVKLV